MNHRLPMIALLLAQTLLTIACRGEGPATGNPPASPPQQVTAATGNVPQQTAAAPVSPAQSQQQPQPLPPQPPPEPVTIDAGLPTPPIREDFEGAPKLSLFPRVGDFSPEVEDQQGTGIWMSYIDHLLRTSGPIKGANGTAFAIRSIKTVNSTGFFSPLAVTPDTTYRVSFRIWTDLPKGSFGGAGILEFNEFLMIDEQFPKSLSDKHFLRSQPGVQVTGKTSGETRAFAFRTGANTRMIHLVFFREGAATKEPMVIDDIEIRKGS